MIFQMVASKFLNDDGEEDEVFNSEWAEAAGLDTKDLNKKEVDFLMAIDWSVHVTPRDYNHMSRVVEASAALRELGRRRGQAGCHRRWRDRGGGGGPSGGNGGGCSRRQRIKSSSFALATAAPSATYAELVTLTEAAASLSEATVTARTDIASQMWNLLAQYTIKVSRSYCFYAL